VGNATGRCIKSRPTNESHAHESLFFISELRSAEEEALLNARTLVPHRCDANPESQARCYLAVNRRDTLADRRNMNHRPSAMLMSRTNISECRKWLDSPSHLYEHLDNAPVRLRGRRMYHERADLPGSQFSLIVKAADVCWLDAQSQRSFQMAKVLVHT
jgi:hypothetical protein